MTMTLELMNKIANLQDDVRLCMTDDGVAVLKDFAKELKTLPSLWLMLNLSTCNETEYDIEMSMKSATLLAELEINPTYQACISIAIGLGYWAGKINDFDRLITLASEVYQLQQVVVEAEDDPDLDQAQPSD